MKRIQINFMKEHDIVQLAEQHDFETLSKTEQTFVLSVMSVAEFSALRQSIVSSQMMFGNQEFPAAPKMDKKLSTAFKAKYSPSIFKLIALRPIPLWQVAAACLCLTSLFWYFQKLEQQTSIVTETVYVTKTDTIYLASPVKDTPDFEKEEVTKKVRQSKAKIKKSLPPIATNTSKKTLNSRFEMERAFVLDDSLAILTNISGQSVQDDTLLASFSNISL